MTSATQIYDRPATYADLLALPEGIKGEIIDGVLYTFPRPRPRHARAAANIGYDLMGPFDRGIGGPGGWIILIEPGIEQPRSPEVAPDLAGWRRERYAGVDPDKAITVVPDWVCEVLSPSDRRRYHWKTKRPFYCRIGVRWLWTVDPEARLLLVERNDDGCWIDVGAYGEDEPVRAEPFEAVELSMARWWADPGASPPQDPA